MDIQRRPINSAPKKRNFGTDKENIGIDKGNIGTPSKNKKRNFGTDKENIPPTEGNFGTDKENTKKRKLETDKENIGPPTKRVFNPYRNPESNHTDESSKTVGSQVAEYTERLQNLREEISISRLDRYPKLRFFTRSKAKDLEEKAVNLQEILYKRRKELKKLISELKSLNHKVGIKPIFGQEWSDARMQQLASFSQDKGRYAYTIKGMIKDAHEFLEDVNGDMRKIHRDLRRISRKKGEHPYFHNTQMRNEREVGSDSIEDDIASDNATSNKGFYLKAKPCKLLRGLSDGKCGPTCIAMILSQYQPDFRKYDSPRRVRKTFEDNNLLVDKSGGTRIEDFHKVLEKCGHPISYTHAKLEPEELLKILSPDADGCVRPIIVSVYEKGDPHGHVIVIKGIKKGLGEEHDAYEVLDPYTGTSYDLPLGDLEEMLSGDVVLPKKQLKLLESADDISTSKEGVGKEKDSDLPFIGLFGGGGFSGGDFAAGSSPSLGPKDSGGVSFSGGGFGVGLSPSLWPKDSAPGKKIDNTILQGGDYNFPNLDESDYDSAYYSNSDNDSDLKS